MSLTPTPLTAELYDYLLSVSLREPSVCQELHELARNDKNSNMQISPDQGQFLAFLVKLISAERCIEIGTYMGYSALWIALHLPESGKLIACDISDQWQKIRETYWQKAKVAHKIETKIQPALATLNTLLEDKANKNSFDFAFIDADKENYVYYYEACLALVRPGGLLAFDNTLWGGDVARKEVNTSSTKAIRQLNEYLHADKRIDLSLLPISDGLTLVRKQRYLPR